MLVAWAGTATAQGPARVDAARLDYGLAARALAPGVYVVEGANADFSPANGCNIINTGFIVTGAGVVVVNTGPSRRYGEQLRELIARTTSEPVVQVVHLNLHPDYFLGNQAFADVPRLATTATRAGMVREAKAYEDNLYRLCGDWMKGTEAMLPDATLPLGVVRIGQRELELRELRGHTDSDVVLIDRTSGVMFAGGLVFSQRIPTTPHADIGRWLDSLDALAGLPFKALVPSHGPVRTDGEAIAMTRRYLQWVDRSFRSSAEQGLDMNDVLRLDMPGEFRRWAAVETEFVRNVAHLYPRYEQAVLVPAKR
ncbi:MAG: quinoprotein relay system zinc metallohydrolase 1 [Rubrivivax sp.]|nr:quinoprotein relay system zinc metallohydrolase 1 [Rubrivivax sp.]